MISLALHAADDSPLDNEYPSRSTAAVAPTFAEAGAEFDAGILGRRVRRSLVRELRIERERGGLDR